MKTTTKSVVAAVVAVAVIGVVGFFALVVLWHFIAPEEVGSRTTLETSFRTGAEEGMFTLTNLRGKPQSWCGVGVVSSKSTGTKVRSVVVCGRVEPRQTVHLSAPYPVGSVQELCKGSGVLELVDWKNCSFSVEEVND